MKKKILTPTTVYAAAEAVSKQLGTLNVFSLLELLRRYRNDEVTERLNAVYATEDLKLDPVLAQLQAQALPRDEGLRLIMEL